MNKYSVILEDLVWTLPNLTDTELAKTLPSTFSTLVDHDDEAVAVCIAVLRCERASGLELHRDDYRASVCLIEDDVVN